MQVYSRWVLTDKRNAHVLEEFAAQWGERAPEPSTFEFLGNRMVLGTIEHGAPRASQWDAEPAKSGVWVIGVGDVDAQDAAGSRLFGVITPSEGLTQHLLSELVLQLDEAGSECRRAVFSLRALLDGENAEDVQPVSVRLKQDTARVLVQSPDQNALRDILAGIAGEPIGVTIRAGSDESTSRMATILDSGSVVFDGSALADEVLQSMQQVVAAAATHEAVAAW